MMNWPTPSAGHCRQRLRSDPLAAALHGQGGRLSPSTIHRIWRAFGLQPHRSETFKLSTDPFFVEKVRDIVGLHMALPERALVLGVDGERQSGSTYPIQALDRAQPLLPMRPGQAGCRTHDHTRHGTTSLFAALDIATGGVIGRCYPKHRSSEFRRFLDQVEAAVPANLDIHLVIDNCVTHKTKLSLAKERTLASVLEDA